MAVARMTPWATDSFSWLAEGQGQRPFVFALPFLFLLFSSVGLAVVAMEDGERVSILETDPQGTISYWSSRRSNPEPAVERITNRFRLERALRDLKQKGYTLVIIDTPGSDSDVVTEAIRLADLCLIPAKPSQADIEAAYPTLKATHKFDRKFAFVLNQAPVRGRRPPLAAAALSEVGMLALPYIEIATTISIRSQLVSASRNSHLTVLRQQKCELSGFG